MATDSVPPTPDDDSDGFQQSVRSAFLNLHELKAYFTQFWTAKVDSTKASLRLVVLYAFISVFGILVATTITVTATVLLVLGFAGGLAAWLGHVWLADLLVGLIFIVGVAVVMTVTYPLLTGRLRRKTVRKYQAMKHRQQVEFGQDAAGRAAKEKSHAL